MDPRAPAPAQPAPPSFYRHVGFPEWGVGIALFRDAAQEELTVLFEAGGLRTVPLAKKVLVAVPASRLDEDLRGRLLGMAKGRQPLPRATEAPVLRRRAKPSPEPAKPPVVAPPTKPEPDDSADVMDRKRRIPGSYEAGKRR